jgi:F-type H+-transporting ATPase subunit gamma
MQTLESLNRKIKTAQDLLGVVKTMKSLAAVNIRQFERAVESLEQYRAVVDMGWTVF